MIDCYRRKSLQRKQAMSLNAPYSLAPEPDGAIQISKPGTNPFWTELQTSSHTDAGQQQMAAAGIKDGQNRCEENRESHSSNSYVPPDTVLAKTGHNTQRNLESVNCSAGPGYPAPAADSSNVQSSQANNMRSQELKQTEPHQHSFSGKNPTVPGHGVANYHAKKERPHSLQVLRKPADTEPQQNPVKGILKKPSGSVSFDTTVQISEDGNAQSGEMLVTTESTGFNESDYPGTRYTHCNYMYI